MRVASGPTGGITGGGGIPPPPVEHRHAHRGRRTQAVVRMNPLLVRARAHLGKGGSVLLAGPAGIGKSTLLSVLTTEFAGAGHEVLRCSPSETERHLPFLGLIDLLAETGDEVLRILPAHERTVLESALLRRNGPAGERDGLSLRVAVLSAFRVLCESRPVLIVIDDAQWLDDPSAELLAFVARRAGDLPLNAVAAVRAETTGPPAQGAFGPPPLLSLRVPPMTAAEISALLGDHIGLDLPRPVLAKIHEASGGNPFFALELGRALCESGEPLDPAAPLPVPGSLRTLMLGRLRALSPGAQQTLLTASAAARPTIRLLEATGREQAAGDVAEAERDGIVQAGTGDAVRFTHPLLSAVLYAESPVENRLRAHTALADAVNDPVERARHLALVTPERDAQVAATLSEAATAARRRGAPATAARLGQLAADRTPAGDPSGEADRRLTAAEDAVAACEFALARRIAHDVLACAGTPAERVRAWIIVIDSCGQALAEVDDVFSLALTDASGDPGLLAQLHYRLAWRAWMVKGSAPDAHTQAARSAALAAQAGDRRTELLALTKQAHTELYLGHPDAERTLARALAEPQDPRVVFDHNGPAYLKHRHHLLQDRLEDARTELRALTYAVRQRGAVESLCMCLHSLAQVEVHRGRCARALDLARQCLRLAEDSGLSQGPAWYAVALAEAAGGCPDRALAAAERAQRHSEDDSDLLFLPRTLHAVGHVRLMRGETVQAAMALRLVRRLETGQGLGDPAIRRWQPDLAEALAGTGCADEAAELIEHTRAQAAALGRRGLLATLDRASALVTQARGDLDVAAAELERAAGTLAGLPYPLEEGRTLLALGRIRIRAADTEGARAPLQQARRIFARAEARPWLSLVDAEFDWLDVPSGAPVAETDLLGTLSGVERRVAALVAEGATNREIASRLFVSVKTVEAALTRTFRKLGVRSRVDVARIAVVWREATGPAD
ncbi:MAG: LuxR family transcriptional regulator [Streptosporangiaceae bacterium]|jgi:DNA-binding CsgD family transcriptional regulator|nr:LuxR family transcriptional regulator [Streptosporangiaceae bacterium]